MNKKLKRILAFILAAVMTVTMMAGCGQVVEDDPVNGTPSVSDDNAVTDPEPEVTGTPDDTSTPDTTTEPTTTEEETTTEPTTPAPETTTEPTTEEKPETSDKNDYTVEEMSATMYATDSVNVRTGPGADFSRLGGLKKGEEVTVTGRASTGWYEISFDGKTGYVSNAYLTDEAPDSSVDIDDEDVNIDDGDEDVDIDDGDDNDNSGSVTYGGWISDNGWDYMASKMKDDKYLDTLNAIMEQIQNLETDIYVESEITEDEAKDFANLMLPIIAVEYCYVDSIYRAKLYDNENIFNVKVSYYVDNKADADKMVKQLRNKADKVVGNLKSSWSEYQKAKYLTEWLVLNSVPDKDSYEGGNDGIWASNAYGAIVDGKPTCLGYAKGLLYLLSKSGFDVCFAEGVGHEAKHIWVKVKIGGEWYNIDPTWCDPLTPTKVDPNYVDYSYFLTDDAFMARTHAEVYDMTFYKEPKASSKKYNWFEVNDCYASSYSEAVKMLKEATKEAVKGGDDYEYVRIRFATEELYSEFSADYKKSAYNNSILSDISSKYICGDVIPLADGWVRIYRLVKQ